MKASKISKIISHQFNSLQFLANFATKKLSVREAINSALREEMERDDRVFLMGEEVGKYNGAYKISKGLLDKFGERRVIDTPITEQGFTGIGVGAAMYGLRPIIEFMSFNFSVQALDQIINSCAKGRYMSGGDLSCPIVFRGANGPSLCLGATHSQCFAAWYSNIPGLIVLSPYDSEDARGLLKAAIRDPNPVIFLENEILYNDVHEVDEAVLDKDYLAPIGKARIMKSGNDVTLVSYNKALRPTIKAAEELQKEGVSCEVINLRTLRPLDRQAIVNSVKKTKNLITVEEGFPQSGVGSEICALLMESSAFDYLDSPVQRITSADIPLPYSQPIEAKTIPQVENIKRAVNKIKKTK